MTNEKLCGLIFDSKGRCPNLKYAKKEETVDGVTLRAGAVYCMAEGKASIIAYLNDYTGYPPEWCSRCKKKEEGMSSEDLKKALKTREPIIADLPEGKIEFSRLNKIIYTLGSGGNIIVEAELMDISGHSVVIVAPKYLRLKNETKK